MKDSCHSNLSISRCKDKTTPLITITNTIALNAFGMSKLHNKTADISEEVNFGFNSAFALRRHSGPIPMVCFRQTHPCNGIIAIYRERYRLRPITGNLFVKRNEMKCSKLYCQLTN
jgi:hypothetical protein